MAERDPAAARFAVLQLARLASMGAALAGAAMLGGALGGSQALGTALFAGGASAFFGVPYLLARRWRSPPE